MSSGKLMAVVVPPKKPVDVGNEADWNKVEKKLNIVMPKDYKDFIQHYGSGNFADFLHIFNPFSTEKHLSFSKKTAEICDVFRDLKYKEGDSLVPFNIYPDQPGLLPFAQDDNGDYLFWLTEGKPDNWPIVVFASRLHKHEKFHLTLTEYLFHLVSGKIKSSIFPPDFPNMKEAVNFYPAKAKAKRKKSQ